MFHNIQSVSTLKLWSSGLWRQDDSVSELNPIPLGDTLAYLLRCLAYVY